MRKILIFVCVAFALLALAGFVYGLMVGKTLPAIACFLNFLAFVINGFNAYTNIEE